MTKDEAFKTWWHNEGSQAPHRHHDCEEHTMRMCEIAWANGAYKEREALAQPEQKYRRGDRLVCLETDEYCVIHIAGTDRQWVKFPDTHIGVYTNEQVDELFEKLAKETDTKEQEALTLALKALKPRPGMPNPEYESLMECAIEAIEEVMAQHDSVQAKPEPEQEPVAMRYDFDGYGYKYIDSGSGSDWKTRIKGAEPLHTTPPQRKPLTRERLVAMADIPRGMQTFDDWVELFGREIEAAHDITGDKK